MTGSTDLITQWAEFYAAHDAAQLSAACGHLLAIAYALSYAIPGDRAALRITDSPPRDAKAAMVRAKRDNLDIMFIMRAHRHVIAGLACALITGLAQLLAQLDVLPRSPIFWTKMFFLVCLIANGRIIQLADRKVYALINARNASSTGDQSYQSSVGSSGLRSAAIRSVALWGIMLLMGLLLTTVRP
jgi:hypothetical protein